MVIKPFIWLNSDNEKCEYCGFSLRVPITFQDEDEKLIYEKAKNINHVAIKDEFINSIPELKSKLKDVKSIFNTNKNTSDIDENIYQKIKIIDTYYEYAENMVKYGTKENPVNIPTVRPPKIYGRNYVNNNTQQQNIPKCPTCGSTNIKKISDTAKVAGALMFGLLSKTAKSQFKCNNCGYKW